MNREEGRIVNASMSIVIDSAYIPFSSMWLNKPMKNLSPIPLFCLARSAWYFLTGSLVMGFPGGASGKEPSCQGRRGKRCGFDPWFEKIPWKRAWQPTPEFLPGESHGERSLAGYTVHGIIRVGCHLSSFFSSSLDFFYHVLPNSKSLSSLPPFKIPSKFGGIYYCYILFIYWLYWVSIAVCQLL